jgi:uncharacterized membrane protein
MTDDEETRKPLLKPAPRPGTLLRVRNNFLTGIVIFAPISITIYLVWLFLNFVDSWVLRYVPDVYNPAEYLPITIPGIGLVFFFFFVAALGALTKGFFGRQMFRAGERIVDRMPIVRSIYTTLKQIVETIFAREGQDSFEQVCLVEYPRRGIWAVAFVTTDTTGEIAAKELSDDGLVSIFLPTTPNPTSGFLLFVPKKDIVPLDMSVEEAAKQVISAGLVTPPWPPLTKEQKEALEREDNRARITNA